MISQPRAFPAFAERDFYQVAQQRLAQVHSQIERIAESTLKRDDPEALAQPIIQEFTLVAPTLDFESVQKTISEREVEDLTGFAGLIASRTGGSPLVKRPVITYRVPLTGDPDLLHCRPSTYSLSAPYIYIGGMGNAEELCFDVIRSSNNPSEMQRELERVRQEAEQIKNQLSTLLARLTEDVSKFNTQLQTDVLNCITSRKQQLQSNDDFLSQL